MYAPNANHASAMVSVVYNFEVRSAPADSSFLVVLQLKLWEQIKRHSLKQIFCI